MKRAEEMTVLMETVESQRRAFHEFPQALGNLAHTARFPHSLGSDKRAEKWKTKSRFPTFPRYGFIHSPTNNRPSLWSGQKTTQSTGAPHLCGLHSYLTQPTPVWVTSLNELTGYSAAVQERVPF